jgi:hypothetical protein
MLLDSRVTTPAEPQAPRTSLLSLSLAVRGSRNAVAEGRRLIYSSAALLVGQRDIPMVIRFIGIAALAAWWQFRRIHRHVAIQ